MKAVYRYEVPVDDQIHGHKMRGGQILHVDCRRPDLVEFWATYHPYAEPAYREFQVFGTGQPIPDLATLHGSALTGPLVWHLAELPRP